MKMFIVILMAAMAMADDNNSGEVHPQLVTNPANVVFRTVQAAPAAKHHQYVVAPHFFAAPQQQFVTRFIQPQPAVQPIVARFIPQPVQPVIARTIVQPAPIPVAVKAAEPEPFDPNPQYNYGYEINAQESSVYSGHKESRQNGEVTGEYRVLDPNGDLRITRYTAGVNGYNAEVEIQKGAGPVYQPTQQQRSEPLPSTRPVAIPVTVVRPAAPTSQGDDSGEKKSSGAFDANVVSVRRPAFFQAPIQSQFQVPFQSQFQVPFQTQFQAPGSQARFTYVTAVPQASHQGFRYVAASQVPQFFANPYPYYRNFPFAQQAAVAPTQQVAQNRAFPSGTSFTRIVHSDGTTVEY